MRDNNTKRDRMSILLTGLDKSSPDNVAANGSCETLNNLRYHGNAWRSINHPSTITEITGVFGQYNIDVLYKHPASAEDKYIAWVNEGGTDTSFLAEISLNGSVNMTDIWAHKKIITPVKDALKHQYKLSHFGNVLIVSTGEEIQYYVYSNGMYEEFVWPAPPQLSLPIMPTVPLEGIWLGGLRSYYRIYNTETNQYVLPETAGDFGGWHGEIALFACLRMSDGTAIAPSAIGIIHEGTRVDDVTSPVGADITLFKNGDYICGVNSITGRNRFVAILPTIRVAIPQESRDNKIIDRVAIYATRINPTFEIKQENLFRYRTLSDNEVKNENFPIPNFTDEYAENGLINQPFYLVAEKNINELKNGEWEVKLSHTLLSQAINNSVYTPAQSLHNIINADIMVEHNNRLHLAGLTTRLFGGYNNMYKNGESVLSTFTRINIDDTEYIVERQHVAPDDAELRWPYNNILSYPDYRATSIQLHNRAAFSLKAATAINAAYYIGAPDKKNKYPTIEVPSDGSLTIPSPINDVLYEKNRLQVSEANNCFALQYDTSYRIGDRNTSIIAITTMADVQFAYKYRVYSLYIFTNNGIFAPEDGNGDILYNSFIFVNHDVITNRNPVSANDIIFYVTSRGLHGISGTEAVLLSEPLNEQGVAPDFSSSRIHLIKRYNELIISDERHTGVKSYFVYSLDNKVWYTRDSHWGYNNEMHDYVFLNNGLLYEHLDGYITPRDTTPVVLGRIYDLEQEINNSVVGCTIITRPVSYQNIFTRIDTFISRMKLNRGDVTIIIEGSNNLREWTIIRQHTFNDVDGDTLIRYTPSTARYYRVTLKTVTNYFEFTGFDIYYYIRYLSRWV